MDALVLFGIIAVVCLGVYALSKRKSKAQTGSGIGGKPRESGNVNKK